MPIRNKNIHFPFKNKSVKLLAEKHDLTPESIIYDGNLIHENDIIWMIDNIYYLKHGKSLYNKLNVPEETRYDTDWKAYTLKQYKNYYGNDYVVHWNNAIVYIPNILDVD